MKILKYLLCLLSLNTCLYAETVIKGTIHKPIIGKSIIAVFRGSKIFSNASDDFPDKMYKTSDVFIGFKPFKHPKNKSQKSSDLSQCNAIMTQSTLKLISFNPKSGKFKFKLNIMPVELTNIEINIVRIIRVPVKGKVYIDGKSNEMTITGRVYRKANKLILITDRNNNFSLDIMDNSLILKAQRNIPVTVKLNL